MPQLNEVYKCELCGNIVEMLHGGPGALTCCNQKMVLQTENTVDAAQEKHVPVIEKIDNGYKVKVGSVAHPMEEKHYITFIDCYIDDKYASRIYLTPLTWASVVFHIKTSGKKVTIVEKCNIHGYWKAEADL